MVGPEVTELIQGYAIARTLEATEAELMATIFRIQPCLRQCMSRFLMPMTARFISKIARLVMQAILPHYLLFRKSLFAGR